MEVGPPSATVVVGMTVRTEVREGRERCEVAGELGVWHGLDSKELDSKLLSIEDWLPGGLAKVANIICSPVWYSLASSIFFEMSLK